LHVNKCLLHAADFMQQAHVSFETCSPQKQMTIFPEIRNMGSIKKVVHAQRGLQNLKMKKHKSSKH
jgi:hypothetical protein